MGAVRLWRIARLLPRYGWDPVVLVHPRDPGKVTNDPGVRLEEVAAPDLARMYSRLRNFGRKSSAPSATRKEPTSRDIGLTSKLNRWVMIPDKQVPWYWPAVRRGRELLRREKFDAIFSSVEPRTTSLVGSRLSKETGIPSVVEFRDLWVGNPYYHIAQATALHRRVHEHLERKVIRRTHRLSAVCQGIAANLTERHESALQAPVSLNYNFFDPQEYPRIDRPASGNRPFTISYAGAMYATRRPDQFFEGMRAFIDQGKLSPEQFRFRWAGPISGVEGLSDVLDRTGVRPYLDFLGKIPHREAMRLLLESDVALLIQAPDDAIHIPGKLFEAMGARVPLLTLSNPCETADIVNRCRAGIVCPYTTASVAAALTEFRRLATQNVLWQFEEAEVQKFSADASVARLAALFSEAIQ